jgi:aspartyl-tRNA(Asn)/glutamyl-tRNA(Gln) amidotransferase subunit A
VPEFEAASPAIVKGKRIGIPKEYRLDGMAPEIEALWEQGIAWLKDAAPRSSRSLPHTKYALPTYYIIAPGRGVVEPRAL